MNYILTRLAPTKGNVLSADTNPNKKTGRYCEEKYFAMNTSLFQENQNNGEFFSVWDVLKISRPLFLIADSSSSKSYCSLLCSLDDKDCFRLRNLNNCHCQFNRAESSSKLFKGFQNSSWTCLEKQIMDKKILSTFSSLEC